MSRHPESSPSPGTPLPWSIVWYDAGDIPHYDHNGPCPLINGPESEDQAVVHWDGFKQEYWSSANGDQKRIEANAAYIVWACNNAPDLLEALQRVERLATLFEAGKPLPEGESFDAWLEQARAALAATEQGEVG